MPVVYQPLYPSEQLTDIKKNCCSVQLILLACLGLLLMGTGALYYSQHQTIMRLRETLKGSERGNQEGTCCPSPDGENFICKQTNSDWPYPDKHSVIQDNLDGRSKSLDEDRAFFLETQGNSALDYRQACAVESLALINPKLVIYVLFTGNEVDTSVSTMRMLKSYNNIRLVSVNVDDYVADTPLDHWYHCTNWRKGPYRVAHLSDGLRLLTLAKYGGFYFDLDIIFIRPVTYYRNFIATENGEITSNGAMHIERGHPILRISTKEFASNYDAFKWSYNGPELLTRMFRHWCGVEKLSEMDYVTCQGFNILPSTSFYIISYPAWQEYFIQRQANDTARPSWLSSKVIGVHVWNKLSAKEPVYKNSTQYYTELAKEHCPKVFSVAPQVFK